MRCIQGRPARLQNTGQANVLGADATNTIVPALPAMFTRYKDSLDNELRAAVPSTQWDSEPGGLAAGLYGMLQYHMGWTDEKGDPSVNQVSQGKALRPTICLFACEALGENWNKALPAATALEFIHNFSLIHDDIQDGDMERRHRPTVWSLWGQPQALIAGNAMRSLADITTAGLTQRGVHATQALRASLILTESYLDMIQGQCLDLAFESRMDIGHEEYLNMIAHKTGALMRCGMEMGALIVTREETPIQAFANCGSFLGQAFQIRDDVLGIWGDEAATGKSVGNDILRKKKSFPVVYALEVAEDGARRMLTDAYSKVVLDQRDVTDVQTVLEDTGAGDYARDMVSLKANLALREIRRVPLPGWARQETEELVDFLTTRQF